MPPSQRARCHFFNTFFYSKLAERAPMAKQLKAAGAGSGGGGEPAKGERAGHARVVKWVKVRAAIC